MSYGVVHLLVAWLTVDVALGERGNTSPGGALKQVAKQPLGGVLLWVMAAGFLTLTIWQLMEAVVGRDDPLREAGSRAADA